MCRMTSQWKVFQILSTTSPWCSPCGHYTSINHLAFPYELAESYLQIGSLYVLFLAPLNPVAFYPLDGFHGTADMGPNPLLSGQPVGVRLAEGPFGNPNGSFYFEGSGNSYVEFKKSAALDTKYSISIFSWIYPEKDGPIFNYMINGWGMHLWVNTPLVLFVRFVFRDHRWPNPLISSELRKQEWNFVGTTYDGNTGLATLWIGNRTVLETNIGKHELATQYGVRMGARIGDNRYFRGKIACLQVYAEAIYSSEEIMAVRKRCSQIPAGELSRH